MFQTWLKIVDDSGLTEKHMHKAWIYQQGIPSRLMWLLLIYEIATTIVASLTSIGLYGKLNPIIHTSILSGGRFKVAKHRLVMTLRDSTDDRVARTGIQARTGRNWSARTSVDQATKSMRRLRDITGNTSIGRQGVEMSHSSSGSKQLTAEKCTMNQAGVRRTEEEKAT